MSSTTKTRGRDVRDATEVKTHRQALRVFFSRKGPRTLAGIAATSWLTRLFLGPPGPTDLVAAAAAVSVWPFQEWVMHKYLLHLEPRTIRGRKIDPGFAKAHRTHHADPRDVDMTLLPMEVIRTSLPVTAGGWLLLFGPSRATITAMAAYSTMALFYEWTHFIVHTNVKPLTRYGKRVRRNHLLHHFRNEAFWFGFTFPPVDGWLGTNPDPAAVDRSPTARDLFGLNAEAEAHEA